MVSQTLWIEVVCSVLGDIPPSNFFTTLRLSVRVHHQKCHAAAERCKH